MPRDQLTVSFADVLSAVGDGDDAIFELAPDGTIVAWSRSAERKYGFSAKEMIGHAPTRLVPRDLINTERRWLGCVFADGRGLRVETKRMAKDGSERIVSLNLIPLRDPTGVVVAAAAIERELHREPAAAPAPHSSEGRPKRPAPARTTPPRAPSGAPLRGTETVLVVDDEQPIRELICHVLKEHGYVALEATNGEDALRVTASFDGPIHLVVSDVAMPQMDGRALFAQIRTWYPDVPFMFMSGSEPAIAMPDVFDGSPTRFLAKPFGMNRLLAEVRQVLDSKATRKRR